MKKRTLNWWCDRAWIKCGCLLAAIMMGLLLVNWRSWGTDLKVTCAIAILIPIHVIEEWVFPGGFHYQYNVGLYRSAKPNYYPMCRLSDMYTNSIATVMYVLIVVAAMLNHNYVAPGVLLGTAIFAALELFMHTLMGTMMYFRFKDKGKTTIYGPGSVTAYFGFVPLGIIALFSLQGRIIHPSDWWICIGILLIIGVVCILIPENLIKNLNTPYYFKNAGYFERFLK